MRALGRVRHRTVWLVLLSLAATSGCVRQGLSFVRDERVAITRPVHSTQVSLPFDVAWTVDGFDGAFGVFFDSSPMAPGAGVESLVPEGDPCARAPSCPDAQWLADRGIFITEESSLRVEFLPDLRRSGATKDRHELSIVLLDRAGHRLGESVWVREFLVERAD